MRMQSGQNNCGPAALANAFRALGSTVVTEDKVVAAMREAAPPTDAPEQDGAGVRPLQVAAEKWRYQLVPWNFQVPEIAQRVLVQFLVSPDPRPCLLAVDDEEHWVTAIGVIGDRILVADPADAEIVRPYVWDKLALRWGPGYGMLALTKQRRARNARQ